MSKQAKLYRLIGLAFLLTFLSTILLAAQGSAQQQTPLNPALIQQFVDPLPELTLLDGTQPLEIHMREFQAGILPTGAFSPGAVPGTFVWGYIAGPDAPVGVQNTYIGPVVVAKRHIPTEIKYVNDLGTVSSSQLLAYTLSTDQTIHWADPLNGEANACAEQAMMNLMMMRAPVVPGPPCDQHYNGAIPATVHLHGGEVPPQIDGNPESWFTSDGLLKGPAFYSRDGNSATNYAIYRYPNNEEAEPLWFHDHTLGVTRLNVFSGLAGVYLLTDPENDPPDLPPLVPLVIQDRMFDTNGQLFFPAGPGYAATPEHPYWKPEFFGDVIVVNGKAWPYLEVEPKRYRFLFLNGSNARGYRMSLAIQNGSGQPPPIWQIATDGGYMDRPVRIGRNGKKDALRQLLLMPAERAEVIIDFSGLEPGSSLLLTNTARAPLPDGDPPTPSTLGRIMQFRVKALTSTDSTFNPAAGKRLQKPDVRLVDFKKGEIAKGVKVSKVRQLTLNEIMGSPVTINGVTYEEDSRGIFLNNTNWSGRSERKYNDFTPVAFNSVTNMVSEMPTEGDTEVWEIVNLTGDAHPIHIHLVQFQIISRQPFDENAYTRMYNEAFPGKDYLPVFGPPLDYRPGRNPLSGGKFGGNPNVDRFLSGRKRAAEPNEVGWKDTVVVYPGEVTRLAIRWSPTELPRNTPASQALYPFSPQGPDASYVWHCHILDHEDNEMMRPLALRARPGTRSYIQGVDY